METKAVSRYVRIAPRKARIVVDLVRSKSVPQAREILAVSYTHLDVYKRQPTSRCSTRPAS